MEAIGKEFEWRIVERQIMIGEIQQLTGGRVDRRLTGREPYWKGAKWFPHTTLWPRVVYVQASAM